MGLTKTKPILKNFNLAVRKQRPHGIVEIWRQQVTLLNLIAERLSLSLNKVIIE